MIVTGSAAGCSSSRTMIAAGMGGRAPMDQPAGVARARRDGRPGAGPRRNGGDRERRPSPRRGAGARAGHWPQRGATCSAAGRGSRTRFGPPLQRERCRRGDLEVTACVDTTADRQQRDGAVDRAPPAGRPDEHLGTRWVDGADAHAAARTRRTPPPAGRRCRRPARSARLTRAPAHDHEGPHDPDEKGAEDEVAQQLHPPGARVVGDQPPQADDQHACDHRRPRAGRPRPVAHGLGAGVVSRRPRITAADRSASASASTVRMRWARQATATAFTSSGTT